MFNKWLSLVKEIVDKIPRDQTNICPRCGERSIDFQYVGDLTTKIGYLDVWCKTCLRGIHMSRVKIPDEAAVISFDVAQEDMKKRIPNFVQITPYDK